MPLCGRRLAQKTWKFAVGGTGLELKFKDGITLGFGGVEKRHRFVLYRLEL
jgi:hypothetical protein